MSATSLNIVVIIEMQIRQHCTHSLGPGTVPRLSSTGHVGKQVCWALLNSMCLGKVASSGDVVFLVPESWELNTRGNYSWEPTRLAATSTPLCSTRSGRRLAKGFFSHMHTPFGKDCYNLHSLLIILSRMAYY